jgi:two-component system cell cycle response regulator
VLEEFAKILAGGRTGDVSCRYGGEEFAIILPRTDVSDAAAVAERFRETLKARTWPEAKELVATASFGAADLTLVSEPNAKALLQFADDALYAAKQNGRDRVEKAARLRETFLKQSA